MGIRNIDLETIIVGDINNPFSFSDRPSKLQVSRQSINYIIDQADLADVYRTSNPENIKHLLFLATHRVVLKLDHILGQNIL